MKPLSRRAILRGLGGAALPLPFLEAMRPAFGQSKTAPKRVIFMYSSNGSVLKNWKPPALGPNPPASRILQPLAAADLKPYLTVLSGLRAGNGQGHAQFMCNALTGSQNNQDPNTATATGISLDFALGKRVKDANPSIPFETLQFGVHSGRRTYLGPLSYRGRAGGGFEPVFAEDNPATMYSRLFTNSVATGGGDPAVLARLNQILAQDKSALDFTMDEYKQLGSRLGAADRTRLEEHAALLRSLEQRMVVRACNKPTLMNPAATSFRAVGDMQMDMLAAAFACDQTRVATLLWSSAASEENWAAVDPTLKIIAGRTSVGSGTAGAAQSYWHPLSHFPINWDPATTTDQTDRDTLEVLTRAQIWLAERLAYLARKLKGYTDSNGKSVLDNTLIFWTTECAEGNHGIANMPYTMVGNMGGALKSNVHLAFAGRPHVDILATIGTAMGFSGFEKFGFGSRGVLTEWLA